MLILRLKIFLSRRDDNRKFNLSYSPEDVDVDSVHQTVYNLYLVVNHVEEETES